MMEFVLMTLSFALGILLASGIVMVIIMQPKVMKAYMKWVFKQTKEIENLMFEEDEEL